MAYLDDFGTSPPSDGSAEGPVPLWQQQLNLERRLRDEEMRRLREEIIAKAKEIQIPAEIKDSPVTATTESPIISINIDMTLAERGNRYGPFLQHATATQDIKSAMVGTPNWSELAADQKEALEMIAHKIGRILCGDPNYHDSWWDLIGYAKLVADRLEKEQANAKA